MRPNPDQAMPGSTGARPLDVRRLEQDTPPQEISDMLGSPDLPDVVTRTAEGVWWSEGSPRVKAARIVLRSLPDVATYAAMLGAGTDGTNRRPTSPGTNLRGRRHGSHRHDGPALPFLGRDPSRHQTHA